MKSIGAVVLILILSGCSFLQKYNNKDDFKKLQLEKKWARSTLNEDYLGYRAHHRMSPIVTKDFIIQGNAVDGLVAYDRQTVHKLWRLNIKNGVEAGGVIYKDNLYFGASDSYFYCVNYFTGQIQWSFPILSEGLGRPFVRDGVVYFVSGNNVGYALDAGSGRQLWLHNRKDSSALSIRGGSQPNVYQDKVFMAFSDGYLVALNRTTGQVIWERLLNHNRRFNDIDSQPVIYKGKIYLTGFDSALYAIDPNTGNTLWRYDEGGFSRPYVDDETVIYATTNSSVVALERDSGKKKWEYKLKQGLATSPVEYKGMIIFGQSEGALKVVSKREGKELVEFNPIRGVSAEPVVKDFNDRLGNLYIMTREANLIALDLNWKKVSEKWHWEE